MIDRNRMRRALLSATMLAGLAAGGPARAQDAVPPSGGVPPEEAAGQSAETGTQSSNDIVVTATRRSVTLQDVPINISALSSATLKEQRLDDVADIAAFTPGLTVIDNGPRTANNIVLRGITAGGTGGANANDALGVYLGEVPLYLDFKFLDIDRVETLLGPQGTLYGRGTLSGAVRYIPNRPNFSSFGGEAHGRFYGVSHASDPGFQGDVTINVPIVADKIAFRSVVGYYEDPGFIDYPFKVQRVGVSLPQPNFANPAAVAANLRRDKDQNDEQTLSTRNVLGLDVGPLRAYLTYLYQRTETAGRQVNGAFGSRDRRTGLCNYADCRGVLGTGKYEAPFRVDEPSDRKAQLFSAEVELDVGEIAQIVSATAYTKQKLFARTDVTDLLLDLDYDYELFPAFAGPTQADTKRKQFNQEVRIVSTHDGPFSWVVGGFYNKLENYTFSAERFPGLPEFLAANSTGRGSLFGTAYTGLVRPDGLEYISFTDSTNKEYAAFGEATFRITDKWQVTGGTRYYKYKAEITGATDTPLLAGGRRRTPFPLIQFDPSRVRSGSTKDDGFVFKANTSYEFSDQLFAYATYSEGFRVGGVNRVAPCIIPLPPGQNVCALPNELQFGPDKTENKELGVRFNLFDRRFQGTVAVYHIKWDDVQVPSSTANGNVGITANAAAARSQGVESNFSARLGRFTLSGNYTYNDSKLTEDAPGLIGGLRPAILRANPQAADAFDGDRLPVSPKHAGSLTGSYTLPVADESDLTFLWTTQYRGNILTTTGARNTVERDAQGRFLARGFGEKVPDFFISRASITWRRPKFDVSIFANNIFDNYYIVGVGNDYSRVGVNDGVVKRYYNYTVGTPRVFGIESRVRF